MPQDPTKRDPDVIEYIPKNNRLFDTRVISALIIAWVAVLAAAFILKSKVVHRIWPAILLTLLVYLFACIIIAYRKK